MGYEDTVERLLLTTPSTPFDDDWAFRYIPYFRMGTGMPSFQCYWMYRMISTHRPLEEKMALFWHQIFATSYSKLNRDPQMNKQLQMFRRNTFVDFRTILVELAQDPSMIYWLDSNENHKGALNENFGRELLELFSMGVGMDGKPNYTEEDVKECARAFTGWTMAPALPRYPYGDHVWDFEYQADDHDDGEKVFLGQRGRFGGEDVIDIIVGQPATARFLARHLYIFFLADEPQDPAWQNTPPRDPEAIRTLEDEYFRSNHNLGSMLRLLFNLDFFKEARFSKVKSPAELVSGVMRLVDDYTTPKLNIHEIAYASTYMGQDRFNPPTVEGWHTGPEWIDSGALVERVNFAAGQVGDLSQPGVRRIVERLSALGPTIAAEVLVDASLDLVGPMQVGPERRDDLIEHVNRGGPVAISNEEDKEEFAGRVARLLQLIVSSREFQLG